MPKYGIPQAGSFPNSGQNLTTVMPGDTFTLISATDSFTAPQASVAFCRGAAPGTGIASPIVFQAVWASTPTAEVDIQASNTDVDGDYVKVGAITTQAGYYADGGGFQFYRAYLASQSAGGVVVVTAKG